MSSLRASATIEMRRIRPRSEPTRWRNQQLRALSNSEQRHIVKTLTGLGLPQKHICRLVTNPQTGKPLDPSRCESISRSRSGSAQPRPTSWSAAFVAIAAQVGDDNREILRQAGRHLAPHHMRLRIPVEQQQRRPATACHQVDRRAGGLDLPLFEAGKEVGHRILHFSHYSSHACLLKPRLRRGV
jgi:hypothetical protein